MHILIRSMYLAILSAYCWCFCGAYSYQALEDTIQSNEAKIEALVTWQTSVKKQLKDFGKMKDASDEVFITNIIMAAMKCGTFSFPILSLLHPVSLFQPLLLMAEI